MKYPILIAFLIVGCSSTPEPKVDYGAVPLGCRTSSEQPNLTDPIRIRNCAKLYEAIDFSRTEALKVCFLIIWRNRDRDPSRTLDYGISESLDHITKEE